MPGQRVRTVELHLLRQGPPHNQLLSPLTDYLALCGDHPNTTLNFPLEHESLRVRLRALRYQDSEETRRTQLNDTAFVVGEMFAAVPGLISELGWHKSSNESLVHLSIATTAVELSLVPFELAHAPPGFPGSGGSLSLQNDFPVCITRRSRNVRFDRLNWCVEPRILMVASGAAGKIPVGRHYALLRKLVEPYVKCDPLDPESSDNLNHVRDRLVLLTDANVRSIDHAMTEAINEQRPFSHVHILAHGCPLPRSSESYGVGLHSDDGQAGVDAVEGKRLGQLLSGELEADPTRPISNQTRQRWVRPNVVTLAVCDSGATGFDVSVPGSSIAFNLHEAGIPLVVGSSFPLTFGGSVVLTESLYQGLLEGDDPRDCLWRTRQDLFVQNTEKLEAMTTTASMGRHDWCSMLAFAALPTDIESQSRRLQRDRQKLRMETQLEAGDELLEDLNEAVDRVDRVEKRDRHTLVRQLLIVRAKRSSTVGLSQQTSNSETRIDTAAQHIGFFMEKMGHAVEEFDRFVDEVPASISVYLNLLGVAASANRRAGELIYSWGYAREHSLHSGRQTTARLILRGKTQWITRIRKAYKCYVMIAERDRNRSWAFVQSLFLQRFLAFFDAARDLSKEDTERQLLHNWLRAKYICEDQELRLFNVPQEQAWHLTDMIELALLRTLTPGLLVQAPGEHFVDFEQRGRLAEDFGQSKVFQWLRQMDQLSHDEGADTRFAIAAGQRQLLRYRTYADMFHQQSESESKSSRDRYRRDYSQWGYDSLGQEFKALYEPIEAYVKGQLRDNV